MRLKPIRALLAAHTQSAWNRSARELGAQGAWVQGLVTGLVALLGAGPLLGGMGVLGWIMGRSLEQPLAAGLLGGTLSLLSLGGGLFGGVAGDARHLGWEASRAFPLRTRELFAAEVAAGLGDPFPMLLAVALLGLVSGVGLGAPSTLPLLPLVFLETLLTLLALQLLVGSLAQLLVKRLRFALLVLAILAWIGSTLMTARLPGVTRPQSGPANRAQLARVAERTADLAQRLPAHQAARSLALAREGRWTAALAAHALPLGFLALLLGLGLRVIGREARLQGTEAGRGAERLWSFRTPAEGLGRLHFRTLMASQLGKFAFLMPVMTLVLLKGPFALVKGAQLWAVPAAFAYLSLVGNNFVFNQFGLDRHGIKALLLLPLTSRDLLVGKLLGMALHQGLQALLLGGLLAGFERAAPGPLAAGVLLFGCVFLAQSAVGQWTSAWAPRPMAPDSMKNSNMPFAVGMLSLATAGLWTSLFGGLYALTAWLAPAWVVPVMGLAFGGTLAAHRALLPGAAAYLDRRREVLVERLG